MFRSICRHLGTALLAALVIGTAAGGIEGLVHFQAAKAQNPPPLMILLITAIYGLYFGGLGVVLGLVSGIAAGLKKGTSGAGPLLGRYLLVFLCFYGALFAFGFYQGMQEDPFAAGPFFVGAGALVILAVIAAIVQRPLRRFETRGRGFRIAVTGAWLVFMAVLIVLGARPPKETSGGAVAKPPAAGRPNVLFVLLDALRADHLGCYGYERDISPSIDALAADGVRFERCFAQSSWTRPSIASMLTSTVPPYHQVTDVASVIDPGFDLFPDDMAAHGYMTGSFSASALISRTFGFAMNVDGYKAATRTLSIETGLFETRLGRLHEWIGDEGRFGCIGDSVFRIYNKVYRNLVSACALFREEFRIMKGDAASVNETFLAWLDRIGGARFATYLHYVETHSPYDPDPPFNTMFASDWAGEPMTMPPHLLPHEKVLAQFPPLDDAARLDMINHYDGEIAQFSHEFANLVAELKKRGMYDDTLIVFVSDHGDEFYEHKAWGHGHSMFNELIHVPLIFKFPGSEHAGKVIAEPVRGIDIMPTILEVLGAEPWELAEGTSLMPLIRGEKRDPAASWQAISCTGVDDSFVRSYIHGGRYKLIQAVRGERELWFLFDLDSDPNEEHSLVDEQPELFKELRSKLEEYYRKYDAQKDKGHKTDMSPEMERKLKKLGYI